MASGTVQRLGLFLVNPPNLLQLVSLELEAHWQRSWPGSCPIAECCASPSSSGEPESVSSQKMKMSFFIRRGRRRRRRRWVPTCGRGRYNWRTWWCYTCRAGYYQPYNSHRYGYCFSCGPGRYSSSGASYCSACSAGYYCPSYRMSRRYTCPAGRYSSGTYNRACYVSHTENDAVI